MHETDDGAELNRLAAELQRRSKPREPAKMGDIVNRLIAQRGYLQTLGSEQLQEAWKEAAGSVLADETQIGNVRRGVLEIFTSDSCLIQELTFRKQQLLQKLRQVAPDLKIRDLRFRVGVVE